MDKLLDFVSSVVLIGLFLFLLGAMGGILVLLWKVVIAL